MDALIGLLITLLVLAAVFYVVWWIVFGLIPWPPEPSPLKRIIQAIVALIFLLVALRYLGVYLPGPGHHYLWSTMCLGWKTKANCKARPAVNVTQPSGDTCPNISWFWLALAAIGIGTAMKGSK